MPRCVPFVSPLLGRFLAGFGSIWGSGKPENLWFFIGFAIFWAIGMTIIVPLMMKRLPSSIMRHGMPNDWYSIAARDYQTHLENGGKQYKNQLHGYGTYDAKSKKLEVDPLSVKG